MIPHITPYLSPSSPSPGSHEQKIDTVITGTSTTRRITPADREKSRFSKSVKSERGGEGRGRGFKMRNMGRRSGRVPRDSGISVWRGRGERGGIQYDT